MTATDKDALIAKLVRERNEADVRANRAEASLWAQSKSYEGACGRADEWKERAEKAERSLEIVSAALVDRSGQYHEVRDKLAEVTKERDMWKALRGAG